MTPKFRWPRDKQLFLIVIGLQLIARTAAGDVTIEELDRASRRSVVRLTVTPAPAPAPLLRHRLLPAEIDLKPGNAAPFYYRAHAAFRRAREVSRQEFSEDDELSKWYTSDTYSTPLSALPLDRVRRAVELTTGGTIGSDLAEAVSRRDCDWQTGFADLRGPEIISFPLEEFQQNRDVARMLLMKTRLELAERRYEDAIRTMQMNYRLGRDSAREPILVCGLIGVALSSVTNGTLLELIASPNSPNMYWALTTLPEPMIDMGPAAHFESNFAQRMFPFLEDAESTRRAPEEWNRLYQQAFSDLMQIGNRRADRPALKHQLGAAAVAVLGYPAAKSNLIEQGLDRAEVERMSVGQVIAIHSDRICRQFADEFEALWHVPYWEMKDRYEEVEQRLRAANWQQGGAHREVLPILQILSPAIQGAREAQVRLERSLASLRIIEALRMYAANHNGMLPERLDAITEVPIPLNPATGEAFIYRLEGDTGILDLPTSDGIRGDNRRYEIRIARSDSR